MEREINHTKQFPRVLLSVIYGVSISFFLAILFLSRTMDIPIYVFTGDPLATLSVHPFIGVVSNLGILLWCSTVAICLFSYFYVRMNTETNEGSFLLWSGLFTGLLLFDDLFMIHEVVIPDYVGISEVLVYVAYLMIAATWIFYFWYEIWQSEYKILGGALLFLGGSVIIDVVLSEDEIIFLIEDALKFLGIITWLIYFTRDCLVRIQKVSRAIDSSEKP